MSKTILITGSTDGIGLLAARMLAEQGHKVLLHGRDAAKLARAAADVAGDTETFEADLSSLEAVRGLASDIRAKYERLDVLINNAGVLKAPQAVLPNGQDVRFVVNTLAPYVLTRAVLPIMPSEGLILNLSSAAQAQVNIDAFMGGVVQSDMEAYAQSKLAITIWSQELAKELKDGPVVLAVNPGSLLASKMVKEGFEIAGNDLGIGAGILCRMVQEERFATESGKYWDNDAGGFALPHGAARDGDHVRAVMAALEQLT